MIITEIDPKTRAVVGSPITLFDEEQIQDFRTLRENNKALDALDARDIPSSELSEDEESTSDEDDEEEEGPSE